MLRCKIAIYLIFLKILLAENSLNCKEFISKEFLMHVNWENLEQCLPGIVQENLDDKMAEKVWNLIKDSNDGIENIPAKVYKIMGNILTKIPLEDLRNITIDQGDIVKAFGNAKGFTEEKLKLLADKIRTEWTYKSPEKLSQYDLKALGLIICYFNKTEIGRIHPDAYKEAAGTIGEYSNCPTEIVQEFAKLAVQKDAFGPPHTWSKIDVALIGNIINGLTSSEYSSISPEVLKVNNKINNSTLSSKNTMNSTETVHVH